MKRFCQGIIRRKVLTSISPILVTLLVTVSTPASADAIYCYEGKPFTHINGGPYNVYSTNDRVTGCIILPNALSASSSGTWTAYLGMLTSAPMTLLDGVQELGNSNSDISISLDTDALGQVSAWSFWATDENDYGPRGGIAGGGGGDFALYAGDSAYSDAPGTWSQQPTVVPELSSLILLLWVLVLMGIVSQRVHRPNRVRRAAQPEEPFIRGKAAWKATVCRQAVSRGGR